MQNIIIKYGYFGIFLLIAIENIFPPIPSEVILTFSGFISKYANLDIFLIIISSTLGSIFGAILLYILGYYLTINKIIYIAKSRIGKVLRLNSDKIIESIQIFNNNGSKTIFICRFIPIIRSLISIPAGISRYNFLLFLILTFLGSLIWNTIFILLGNMFGENWILIINIFKNYYKPIILLLFILVILHKKYKKK
jgi:membrane protein DedA with SNARE-associated domain